MSQTAAASSIPASRSERGWWLPATPYHGHSSFTISDIIVIIGGMGSFLGSLIGALLIAFVQVFGNYYLPDFALAFMYLVMLLVLVVRPGGLLGKEA